jgi:hypothetical protein
MSEIVGPQSCLLRQPCQHSGPNFLLIVKRKYVIRPTGLRQQTMRATLKRSEHPFGLTCWPGAHLEC